MYSDASTRPPTFIISIFLAISISSALLFFLFPYWTLLFTPLCFGVPHILCDLYLLVCHKSSLPLRARVSLAVLSLGYLLITSLLLFGINISDTVSNTFIVGLILVPLSLSSRISSSFLAYGLGIALCILIFIPEINLKPIMVHLHNIVALLFFFATIHCTTIQLRTLAFILFATLSVSIVASLSRGLSEYQLLSALTLGFNGASADGILALYAILQILHFAIWIWFLPQSINLYNDLLPILKHSKLSWLVLVFTLTSLPIAALIFTPEISRTAYLALVSFHVWMELGWLLAKAGIFLSQRDHLSFRNLFSLKYCSDDR